MLPGWEIAQDVSTEDHQLLRCTVLATWTGGAVLFWGLYILNPLHLKKAQWPEERRGGRPAGICRGNKHGQASALTPLDDRPRGKRGLWESFGVSRATGGTCTGVNPTNAALSVMCIVTPEPYDKQKIAVPSLTRTPRNSPGRCPHAPVTMNRPQARDLLGPCLLWGHGGHTCGHDARSAARPDKHRPRPRAAARNYVPASQQSQREAPHSPPADGSSKGGTSF